MASRPTHKPGIPGSKPTARQREIAQFVQSTIDREGRAPSRADIAAHFGFNRATAQQHLVALERHGVLSRTRGARGIVMVRPAGAGRAVPILGDVPAGMPLEAFEDPDGDIDIPKGTFRRNPDLMLRVTGDSMKDAGILQGDLIAVSLQKTADSGDIVIARIGGEVTVKRLRVKSGRIELVAENAAYAPIRVGPGQDFTVEGVVLGVLRRF